MLELLAWLAESRPVRFLFLTTVLPGAGRGGGEIVSQAIVDGLRATGAEVSVLGFLRPDEKRASPGEICVGRRPVETADAGLHAFLWMARALACRQPYSVAKYRSRGYDRAARRVLAGRPDLLLLDHAQVYGAARKLRSAPHPCVFVAHNAESRLYAQLARQERNLIKRLAHEREARRVAAAEHELVARASQTWVLSGDDAEALRAGSPGADIRVLRPPARQWGPRAGDPVSDVALLGSWTWAANAQGLRWFAEDVVPQLPRGLSVRVAGSGAEWLRARYANVKVEGFVERADQFLKGARVIAVPARAGSGVQIKTLDAIATGLPGVATALAVRGLDDLPPTVAVRDSSDDFASELVRLAAADSARPDPRALAWAEERTARFRRSISAWCAELVDPARSRSAHAPAQSPVGSP